MTHTYNDFMNEVLKVKADYERQEKEYGWNFKESDTQIGECHEYMITNRAGLSCLVRWDNTTKYVNTVHITDNEIIRLHELIQEMN